MTYNTYLQNTIRCNQRLLRLQPKINSKKFFAFKSQIYLSLALNIQKINSYKNAELVMFRGLWKNVLTLWQYMFYKTSNCLTQQIWPYLCAPTKCSSLAEDLYSPIRPTLCHESFIFCQIFPIFWSATLLKWQNKTLIQSFPNSYLSYGEVFLQTKKTVLWTQITDLFLRNFEPCTSKTQVKFVPLILACFLQFCK